MSHYAQLSSSFHAFMGLCSILLMTLAVCFMITSLLHGFSRKSQWIGGVLCCLCILFMQGLCDLGRDGSQKLSPTFWAQLTGSLPWIAVPGLLSILALFEGLFGCSLCRQQKKRLNPGTIKESFDALPDGVCFARQSGVPLLINTRMEQLCSQLLGTRLQNTNFFWHSLQVQEYNKKIHNISTGTTVTLQFPDGTVWDFRRRELSLKKDSIWQFSACNVTQQYLLNQKLKQQNDQLNQVNEHLRLFSYEVEKVTREKENLAARVKLHDEIGRALLSFRIYLEQPGDKRSRQQLVPLWEYIVSAMEQGISPESTDSLDKVLTAAQTLGIHVEGCSKLPLSHSKGSELLLAALKECINNTARHAHGTHVYLQISETPDRICASFTNDGTPPSGKIVEKGGLKNLRAAIAKAHGSMEISSAPAFVLYIEIPKGES